MVDAEIRFARADGQPFGHRRADHERTRQPRSGGRGKSVDFGQADPGAGQGVREQERQLDQVLTRGGFGDDAAVDPVQVDLRGDLAGEQFVAPAQHGYGGLVAGGFDGQDQRQDGKRWASGTLFRRLARGDLLLVNHHAFEGVERAL